MTPKFFFLILILFFILNNHSNHLHDFGRVQCLSQSASVFFNGYHSKGWGVKGWWGGEMVWWVDTETGISDPREVTSFPTPGVPDTSLANGSPGHGPPPPKMAGPPSE